MTLTPRLHLLLGLALCAASVVPAFAGGLSRETHTQIERTIKNEMSRQQIPGLSVAVVVNNEVAWYDSFGRADLESATPVTPVTMFRLASVSKPITATAIMQLVEKGLIDLDAPVQKYVPDFPEKPSPITTRQLLSHLSGIRHYKGEAEVLSMKHYDSLTAAIAIFKDEPLLFEPGSKRSYTTYGYNLLGCVVEGASKQKFLEYVREHILEPAGMKQTRDDSLRDLISHRARGYVKLPGGELQNAPPFDASNKIPGGGFCSTAREMARFAVGLQSGVLLKPATFEQMCAVQKTNDGQLAGEKTKQGQFVGQSLCWQIIESERRHEVRHGGSQPGVKTILYLAPRDKLAVVLLANLSGAELDQLARQIADLAVPAK